MTHPKMIYFNIYIKRNELILLCLNSGGGNMKFSHVSKTNKLFCKSVMFLSYEISFQKVYKLTR